VIAGLDIVNKAQSTALASAACIIKLVFNHVKPHLSSAKQSRRAEDEGGPRKWRRTWTWTGTSKSIALSRIPVRQLALFHFTSPEAASSMVHDVVTLVELQRH